MKIGIDARFFRKSTAGLGRYSRGLLYELAKIDQKNDYYVFITPDDDKEYDIKADNFHKVVTPIIHYTLSEQTKFLNILNSYKFDLVHFLNFNHPVLYNRPFVITMHDLTMLLYPVGRSQKSALRKFAFKQVLSNAVKKSKHIIAITQNTKKDLVKYLDADSNKISVIYEGYDEIYKPHAQYEVQQLRQKLNLKNPFILFVSQWRPHKGLPKLIKSFEFLKDKYNLPHDLVITGKPNPDFPDIIASIKTSKYAKNIITPGFVDEEDLPVLYNASDVFVFPSIYEGFGLGALEAMATGTAVASSNLSCMPEVLGDGAAYFNPNNIEEMAKTIAEIINNQALKKSLISRGQKRAKEFSWNKMAKETLDIYNKFSQKH